MKTDFDVRIKELYDSGEFEYNPNNWTKLESKLHPTSESNKSWKILGVLSLVTFKQISAAASVLFAVGLSVSYLNNTPTSLLLSKNELIKTQSNVSDESNIAETHDHDHANQKNSSYPSIKTHHLTSLNSKYSILPTRQFPLNTNPVHDENKAVITTENQNVLNTKENNLAVKNIDHYEDVIVADIRNLDRKNSSANYQNPIVVLQKENNRLEFNGLTFVGSIAKGANNTAYSAGVSYQASIGNRFFVDGSVSLYSSYIQEVVMFNSGMEPTEFRKAQSGSGDMAGAPPPSNTNTSYYKTLQSSAIVMPRKEEETQSINFRIQDAAYAHVAINPSLGYKISKRFSAKAGLDVQKRISNTQEEGFVEENSGYKPLPNYDIGFTPKFGIIINEHWQTNLAFRKGVNNIISNKNYFNRDYFQFQLGYRF